MQNLWYMILFNIVLFCWTPDSGWDVLRSVGFSALLSFHPSVWNVFSELNHRIFIKLWNIFRNPYEVLHNRTGFFEEKKFASKMAQNWPKLVLIKVSKVLVINVFCIWWIMWVYIICYILVQIQWLVKIWIKILWANQMAGFLNQSIL